MATSAQLSVNNQNAQVWTNWSTNTERNFKSCVKEVFNNLNIIYPSLVFKHKSSVRNNILFESFTRYDNNHIIQAGSDRGTARPDGGVILVQGTDTWYPVFIGENKHQENNPGNAIERSLKNISFFKNYLITEDYFPYLISINGAIVNDSRKALFDRITQDGGFMPVNTVFVKSNPKTPRLRPFTVALDKEFNYDKIRDFTLKIISESLDYLLSNNKLPLSSNG